MPYIVKENRPNYDVINEKVMGLIPSDNPLLSQAHAVGCFTACLIQEIKKLSNPSLNYGIIYMTSSGTEIKLREYAAELARTLPGNMESMAGDLNYSLSSLCWGLCGDAPDRDTARYCMRSFIKGALWRAFMTQVNYFTGEEYIFFAGVITDIIDEMYRRRTANYEDAAMEKNGDLWAKTVVQKWVDVQKP